MYFEFLIVACLIIAVLIAYSEYTKHPYVGIIGGAMLIILGVLLLTDATGIQFKTGETVSYYGLGLAFMGVRR